MRTKLRSLAVLTAVIGLVACAETQSVNPDPEEEVAADTSAADDGVQDTAVAADVVDDMATTDDVQDAAGEVLDALEVDTIPCSPNCEGKACGSDGCGGDCGTCEPGQGCSASGQCGSKQNTCTPDCFPCKACTSQEDCSESEVCQATLEGNFCLATCLTDSDCAVGESCIDVGDNNLCTALKSCAPKECGPDGCGGVCGECDEGSKCSGGQCNSGAEAGCGDIPAGVGCCDGDTHKVCEFLSVVTTDCAELGFTCGWNNVYAMYSCGFEGSSPLPQYPKQCGEVCVPDCEGKGCGTDGCGGSCGECAEGEVCSDESMCCSPNCEGKSCGESDGCGGTCTACPEGEICRDDTNVCCKPCCEGKQCGGNCCGGNCGECPLPLHQTCQDYKCKSTPCGTKPKGCCFGAGQANECYDDGTNDWPSCLAQGGWCGWTGSKYECGFEDIAVLPNGLPPALPEDPSGTHPYSCDDACTPQCFGKTCGPDGCGLDCGTCGDGQTCDADGQCVKIPCVADCEGKMCGPDGCGGECGQCADGETCTNGGCDGASVECGDVTYEGCCDGTLLKYCGLAGLQEFDCEALGQATCGWDEEGYYACGGEGADPSGAHPIDCEKACVPSCFGKFCGPDGCGGSCGECGDGFVCKADGLCEDQCGNGLCELWETPYACPGDCGECFNTECGNYLQSCMFDEVCAEGIACIEACGKDKECVSACATEASMNDTFYLLYLVCYPQCID